MRIAVNGHPDLSPPEPDLRPARAARKLAPLPV
jgi:hypothetical protein